MTNLSIPIFPLHVVLFPGGALPLRIFEPRYLDMVSNCLRSDSPFGICLIEEGSEVGPAARPYPVGTLASVRYFQQLKDGCLGLTIQGGQRFRILSSEVLPNQLTVAEVELLPEEPRVRLPEESRTLADHLRTLIDALGQPYVNIEPDYDNASWVSARLTELLPLPLMQKQRFLQLTEPLERLERLACMMEEFDFS